MRHAEAKGFRSPQWIEQGDQYSGTPHPYPVLMWLIDHLFPDFLAYVREGDTVVVHSLDRLGRNLDDLRRAVTDLNSRGISIEFLKEHLTFAGDDSDSSLSKLMFNMLASFAEFERSLIRERQREGIALAKKKGVYAVASRRCRLNRRRRLEGALL